MSEEIQKSRLTRAMLVTCGLLAAIPVSGFVGSFDAAASTGTAPLDGIRATDLVAGIDATATLERIESAAQPSKADLPDYFALEIGLPPGAHDFRVNNEGDVVGYVLDGGVDEALACIREHMREKGWTEVPLGDVSGATFVKEGGACEWTLATCSKSGESTCVVFRSVVA